MARRRAMVSALAVLLVTVWLSACAAPIAPGYSIAKESRQIEFVPGDPPELHVQMDYTLVNSGATDLSFIDVTLPDASTTGRTSLRAELDGQETPLEELPPAQQFDSPNTLRLRFASPWRAKQRHELTIEYAFRSPQQNGATITLGTADFHLGSRGAFAALQAPKHLLAPFPKRPPKMFYTVRVPSDFRVLARGRLAGRKEAAGRTDHRYELSSDDLAIYVVGGRYVESAPQGSGAIFWTFQPMTIDPAGTQEIAAAWSTLQKDYGPLDRNIGAPHVVEATRAREALTADQGAGAVAFPGGALVNSAALAEGTGSEAFLELAVHALAHNWFGDQIYPQAEARLGLGEGLPEYATIVIDQARGGDAARRRRIGQLLSDYDAAVRAADEKTLAVSLLTDPPAQRQIALAKAPLFFAALEDECGANAMRKGLSQMVALLRGQQVDYNALRSSLEETSGKNLAPVFRLWLNEKGIPADFRARYSAGATNASLLGGDDIRHLQFEEEE